MRLFKQDLYSSTEEELEENVSVTLNDETVKKYIEFQLYLNALINRKKEWAICFRGDLRLRGSNTNNYCEAQFLVLKV